MAPVAIGSTKNSSNEAGEYFFNGAGGTLRRGTVYGGTNGLLYMPNPPRNAVFGAHLHLGPYNTGVRLGQGPSMDDVNLATVNRIPESIVSRDWRVAPV